jgi:hypothetical protein
LRSCLYAVGSEIICRSNSEIICRSFKINVIEQRSSEKKIKEIHVFLAYVRPTLQLAQ